MLTYIISLKPASDPRNEELASLLSNNGFRPRFITAVYGPNLEVKTYYNYIIPYWANTGYLLSPSELGCVLSHRLAYETFLNDGAEYAFFLEDDAILVRESLRKMHLMEKYDFPKDSFIQLSEQNVRNHLRRQIRGKKVSSDPDIFILDKNTLNIVYRTVGYMLFREGAQRIFNVANATPYLADNFPYIKEKAGLSEIYLSELVGHPADLSNSSIEIERRTRDSRRQATDNRLLYRLKRELVATYTYRKQLIFDKLYKNRAIFRA